MKAQSTGPALSTVFVDYDNIYLSLKRKNDEAAKRFAKDAGLWLGEIASGRLITSNGIARRTVPRRIVMNRCYGNPIPRRNAHDNSTDMNSFPFVRHHFLRAGFEVIDCPPLTAQLKNSADIRMVMDVRDYLNHDTYFDEFIILSSDADFTPVLHRLRAHARRNIIFTNDNTAAPYTAICDGEVREADLLTLLLEGALPSEIETEQTRLSAQQPSSAELASFRKVIISEVIDCVRSAGQPVPLEALADRAVRTLGHGKTVGSQWGGAGGFRELLLQDLPQELIVSPQPPYFVFDSGRQIPARTSNDPSPGPVVPDPVRGRRPPERRAVSDQSEPQPASAFSGPYPAMERPDFARVPRPTTDGGPAPRVSAGLPHGTQAGPDRMAGTPARSPADGRSVIQQSIARIHDACQAPPLAPPEYRALFQEMASEINANNLSGAQTLENIVRRCKELGIEVRRDDVRFVLEVVSEADPWFEQGASASLFASRFRNFVVARCRSQGLSLSADELDLIEAWFGGTPAQGYSGAETHQQSPAAGAPYSSTSSQHHGRTTGDPWWDQEEARQHAAQTRQDEPLESDLEHDDFPRIIRSRLRN